MTARRLKLTPSQIAAVRALFPSVAPVQLPVVPRPRTPVAESVDPYEGAVYFLRSIDSGLIKIGFTRNLDRRLGDLRRMSGSGVEVLLVVPEGGRPYEGELHRAFAATRRHGEWFDPSPELLAYIAASPFLVDGHALAIELEDGAAVVVPPADLTASA